MPRTARDLSGSDLGTDLTITGASWSLTGTLTSVEHQAEMVDVSRLSRREREYLMGNAQVALTVGPWSGTVRPEVEVSDADPGSASLS